MNNSRINTEQEIVILNKAAATGTGTAVPVVDYMHCMLTLSSASSANFTIKFQGSCQTTAPDFSAAASDTNRWTYIQVRNMATNAAIDGATGVSYTGTDAVNLYEANVNGLTFINATITARSAGNASLRLMGFSNQ